MTQALDLLGIGGAAGYNAIKTITTGDQVPVKQGIPRAYLGYDFITKTTQFPDLIKGYGGSLNRQFIEKKLNKMLGVRPPRSKIETVGDVLDYVSYFGKTAIEVYENRADPAEAFRVGYKTQYGVDLNGENYAAWQPQDMIMEKLVPYWIQKKLRKIVKIPKMKIVRG